MNRRAFIRVFGVVLAAPVVALTAKFTPVSITADIRHATYEFWRTRQLQQREIRGQCLCDMLKFHGIPAVCDRHA